MKQVLFVLLVSTGLIFGCNSNNKGVRKGFLGLGGKKARFHALQPSGAGKSGTASSSSDSTSSLQSNNGIDSLGFNTYGPNTSTRPFTNFGGSVGMGTGGSFASQAYRHDLMNRKNTRREYFRKRMAENDRLYYGEEANQRNLVQQDSLSNELEWPSDSTSTTTAEEW